MKGCGIAMYNKKRIMILIIFIIILTTGCQGFRRPMLRNIQKQSDTLLVNPLDFDIDEDNINSYEIDVELLVEKNQIVGSQRVTYTNNTSDTLKELYFNIYPNAFKDRETAPVLFSTPENSNKNIYRPGFIEINGVKINNKKINFEISGMGETLLKIPLDSPLNHGDKLAVEIKYLIQIPSLGDRFGYYEGVYNLGNWHPILAVYDENGWNLGPYYNIGDPFYSEISNYDVIIRTPRNIIVAATGNIKEYNKDSNYSSWRIEAKLVRDFAWVASDRFHVVEYVIGDTIIKMYYLTKDRTLRRNALEYTKASLAAFEKHFGKYPYGQLSVVETYFPSGMEYPTLIYISEEYFHREQLQSLELVIVHEIGHQWWYGVVGNNQIKEAWLDESLTTYSELVYYREAKGEAVAEVVHELRNKDTWDNKAESTEDQRIWKRVDEFQNWEDYGSIVYSKGATMLVELEKSYSRQILYEALATYYDRYQFKIAKSQDFINIMNEVTGKNNKEFFDKWLLDK